ncbi:class I SAM-dependent methyltransferase [Mucilaginibacter myungsuensis]|uniref:Class I SAM-dependent methyltransferase n=1 Tax=Mucilaginibacter myungsuensis TaxID=649104 RepID=A0A929L5P4_9SPHI|nr:class I SAM-dependent methyltransferase [Mucilaginibacter myungsuensis]MBE9663676.1 class I SAM-dependent methyltransferase [Mucilaginibacter myungsuensis]MDN3599000.1 class I SAM-dependent methyltransferase [Mucilaginibacter myungsuensis]
MIYRTLFILLLISTNVTAQKRDSIYTYANPSPDGTGKFYMGREIAHVMSFEGADWLERDTRNKEENTTLSIAKLPVGPNSVVADIGAGTGYYTFRMAPKVPHGRVYAVEIQSDALAYLNKRSKELNINNITVVKGSERSPNLPDNTVDLAIMVDVYHELAYPHEMLQAIRRSLKPEGKLLLLEYRGEDPDVPIKELHKTTVKQLIKELKANGFKLIQKNDFLTIQHFLVYQKN